MKSTQTLADNRRKNQQEQSNQNNKNGFSLYIDSQGRIAIVEIEVDQSRRSSKKSIKQIDEKIDQAYQLRN